MKTVFGLFMVSVLWTVRVHVALRIRCDETDHVASPESLYGLHDSFWMLPSMKETRNLIMNGTDKSSKIIKLTKRKSDVRCKVRKADGNSPLMKSSTCTWHYVLNVDNERIPEYMFEARCNCKKRCATGGEHSRCEPIRYYYPVYRKSSTDNGYCTYKESLEPITVGCTCVHNSPRKILTSY